MAVQVFGAKVLNNTRMVELMGGWTPFDSLVLKRQREIQTELDGRFNAKQAAAWAERARMHVTFGELDEFDFGSKDEDDSQSGDGHKDDQFGDGGDDKGQDGGSEDSGEDESEPQDGDGIPQPPTGGQGGGSGDDDDLPVMHSEFDPWADKVTETVSEVKREVHAAAAMVANAIKGQDALSSRLDDARLDVAMMMEATAGVQRKVDFIDKAVKDLRANGGGGGSGGVVVRIEVVKPGEPQYAKEGVFHNQFHKLLKLVAGGHHVYLPGPPGSGKSHSAKQVADALGWQFGSISLGPTTPESRLTGGMDANGNFHKPCFVEGLIYAEEHPESGFVFCEDELDNGHPGIIATQNSVMANGFITLPSGRTVTVGHNWVVIGSANTYGTGPTAEFSGRNRLDAATLDRFRYLPWDTDTAMESAMVQGILHDNADLAADWLDIWASCRRNAEAAGLKVFITMRGGLAGATMLAQGWDLFDTLDIVLLNKLPQDQASKINPL